MMSTSRYGSFGGVALALSVGLLGCSGSPGEEPEREERVVTNLTPELEQMVAGGNEFAWSLYGAGAATEGNLFFSPFSVSAAFGMTYAGAAGETAGEMKTVLKIPDGDYHTAFGSLMRDLGGEHAGRGYQLYIANRLFGQAGVPFESDFLELTSTAYEAPLGEVDYAGQAEAARATINGWVSENTRTRIPELLGHGLVDSSTVLVLANAIYFKADWAERFDAALTAPGSFELASGVDVEVPMMTRHGKFRTTRAGGVNLLEIDYKDRELSMVVVLPDSRDGLPALEASLTAESVDALLAQATETELAVSMPRFELEHELPLTELIKSLGMQRAFDASQADFSNMLAGGGVFLSFAVHKAFVKVDERGTEAAAATAVGATRVSMPEQFVANRPFVYLIRDRLTGSILFMGRLADPTASG
jgi:serpin B